MKFELDDFVAEGLAPLFVLVLNKTASAFEFGSLNLNVLLHFFNQALVALDFFLQLLLVFLPLLAGLLVVEVALMFMLDKQVVHAALDYVAWVVWAGAMVLIFLPMSTLRRGGEVPRDKSYVATQRLVRTGIYALVRHPQYLGWMVMYLALLLFNPHWALAVVAALGVACLYLVVVQEDARLVQKFGPPYERYMRAVPRLNLPVGVMRWLRRGR